MKRQQRRSDNTDVVKDKGGRKKVKRAVEAKESIDGKNNSNSSNGGGGDAEAVAVENWCGWEERGWLRGGGAAMDEMMSWGCFWSPFWGVDFVDLAYTDIFSDVAWDDDIWNLKTIVEIPKP